MTHIAPFSELNKGSVDEAGGKGASLGEMTQAGIPVPRGFVVLANAFERFIEETDINIEIDNILHEVDPQVMHTVENASEQIQGLIKEREMPDDLREEILAEFDKLGADFVAVRSSATAEDSSSDAWAGQLDSFLNTNRDTLLENVRNCWASLFTPRAIFYRFERFGDDTHTRKVSVAVVVQKMVNSECSGIAFSVHPVTQDYNQLIIEAGFGLGEAIVSGSVTPDSYVVEKEPRRIIDSNISTQARGLYRVDSGGNEWKDISEPTASSRVLTEDQVTELAELILRVEDHYGFPCDIEWAFENGEFYIVQSRPITTLSLDSSSAKQGKKIEAQELVHLDIPLSLVELHYEQEAAEIVPWASEEFKIKPYIFYNNEGQETYLYYDPSGIEWQTKQAGEYSDKNGAVAKIRKGFSKIEKVLKEEKELGREEFEEFLENVRDLWPWMNYMWWAIEYEDKNGEPSHDLLALRKETEYFTPGLIAVLKNSAKTIYPDKKKYASVLLLSEVENQKIPDDAILEKRLNGYAYTDFTMYSSWDELAKAYNVYIKQPEISGKENLTGQSAFSGKVQGAVRIIRSRKDIEFFQENEVLVASTTTPDFLPAMKKSVAIISEHGGAICHAAITSRELKIPCIVGVSNATKVLKDGDEVEVDADEGVVRKVEKELVEKTNASPSKSDIDNMNWQFEFQQRDDHPPLMSDV